jgi:hypothetical protein
MEITQSPQFRKHAEHFRDFTRASLADMVRYSGLGEVSRLDNPEELVDLLSRFYSHIDLHGFPCCITVHRIKDESKLRTALLKRDRMIREGEYREDSELSPEVHFLSNHIRELQSRIAMMISEEPRNSPDVVIEPGSVQWVSSGNECSVFAVLRGDGAWECYSLSPENREGRRAILITDRERMMKWFNSERNRLSLRYGYQ